MGFSSPTPPPNPWVKDWPRQPFQKNTVCQCVGIAQGHAGAHAFNGCCLRLTGEVERPSKLVCGGHRLPMRVWSEQQLSTRQPTSNVLFWAVGGNGIVTRNGVGQGGVFAHCHYVGKGELGSAVFAKKPLMSQLISASVRPGSSWLSTHFMSLWLRAKDFSSAASSQGSRMRRKHSTMPSAAWCTQAGANLCKAAGKRHADTLIFQPDGAAATAQQAA